MRKFYEIIFFFKFINFKKSLNVYFLKLLYIYTVKNENNNSTITHTHTTTPTHLTARF